MLAAGWAFSDSQAFWKLVFSVFTHVVSVALTLMARLAEMCVSPTKPLRNTTTKLAFELNEIFSMLWAIFYGYFTAIGAYKLFRIEGSTSLRLVHRSHTIFSSSKIWIFAFKTLEICVDCSSVLLWFTKIW